jgi:hypothetical protein
MPSHGSQAASTRRSTGSSDRRHPSQQIRSEDVFLRNYDPHRGYDLEVSIVDADGHPTFEETFYFQPGGTESVEDAVDPGIYDVTVVLDGRRHETATCRIGSAPEHTVHAELGNGTVSLTEGLY